MPFLMLGNHFAQDLIVGGGVVLGDISNLPRPAMPTGVEVVFYPVRPPVGFLATTGTADIPLILEISAEDIVNGVRITLELLNNPAPIFYTLDGSTPGNGVTATCFRYTGPFDLTSPPRTAGNVTVKAKAFALEGSGYLDSVTETLVVTIP